MDPIILYFNSIKDNFMNCTLGNHISILCSNLSFVACHRLTYSFFTGAHFIIKDNKILDIEASEGINGYLSQKLANTNFNLRCYTCENKNFCIKGCRGA